MSTHNLCQPSSGKPPAWYAYCGYASIDLSILACFLLMYLTPNKENHCDNDSLGYDRISFNFYQNNILDDPLAPGNAPIQPVGYPWFLGILYHLFGYNHQAIIFTQLIIHLLTLLLIMRCARLIFGPLIGALSGILYAANIGAITYVQCILAETLLVFMIMLFVERFIIFWQTNKLLPLAQGAFILGLSTLVKPMALVYAPVIALILLIGKRGAAISRLRAIGVILACFYLPIITYMSRNYYEYGTFTFAPMTSLNLYQCYLSKVIAHDQGGTASTIAETTLAFTGANSYDENGWNAQRSLFYHYMFHKPLLCFSVWLENVAKTLVGLFSTQLKMIFNPALRGGSHSFFASNGSVINRITTYITGGTSSRPLQAVALMETIWSILRWLLILLAIITLTRQHCYFILFFFGSFIFMCAFATGIDGCCRYRLTFEPLLVIVTALGLLILYEWMMKKE